MGNKLAFKLKGNESYNISAEKIQKLCEQICHVDNAMCGFVKTLDSLRAACELFLRQCDKRHDTSNESQAGNDEWGPVFTDEELAIGLMKTLEESVFVQKRPAIESLSKLLNYLIDAGTEMIGESDNGDEVLSLDMYLSKEKEEEKAFENMTFTDGRIENLRKQLKLEKELNKTYKTDIEQLEKRDKLTRKEIHIVREGKTQIEERFERLGKEYDQLERTFETLNTELQNISAEKREFEIKSSATQTETNTTSLPSNLNENAIDTVEINALKEERDNLKIENEHMKTALDCIKKKQYIHVQLVLSSDVKAKLPINEILEAIEKSVLETSPCLLRITKVDILKDEINANVPVVFMCFHFDCYRTPSELNSMNGLIEKENIALVAIHRTSTAFIRESEYIRKSETLKDLGEVLNITCGFTGEFHSYGKNEHNIKCISDFVETKGLRKSVVETLGLL